MEEVLGRSHWGTLWSSALVGTIRSGVRLGSTEDSCTKASSVWVPDVAPPTLKSMPPLNSALGVGFIPVGLRLTIPRSLILSLSFAEVTYDLTLSQGPRASRRPKNMVCCLTHDTINLARLHGMSKVLTGKLGLMARAAVSSPEVEEVLTKVALRSATTPTPKKPTERINATS
ncbi:hypothetical protein BHM03_00058122 [Ensete ventricosum]|nr:hypothetical protein BHM03_00058122 [Ensete ventricosum]